MIIDAFPFFNELDLLELRLRELSPIVDLFVLAEAPVTFTNLPKPLFYQDYRRRFAEWDNKVVHVVVDDMPSGSTWRREQHQRDALLRGLWCCNLTPDDWVILGDLDEIPSREAIRQVTGQAMQGVAACEQQMSYYRLNILHREPWYGTRILPWGRMTTPEVIRKTTSYIVPGGGWHFSYLGDVAHIQTKLQSFSHTELATPENLDEDHILHCIQAGQDLYGREADVFTIEHPINLFRLPQALRAMLEAGQHQNWIWEPERSLA